MIAKKISYLLLLLTANIAIASNNKCYAPTIFVPRQLTYNPMLEDSLTLYKKLNFNCNDHLFSIKPIYTQSVNSSLNRYFNPDRKCPVKVEENGSGDIGSLWFKTIAPKGEYYSSKLNLNPKRQVGGALFNFNFVLPSCSYLSINTALVKAKHRANLHESCIENKGESEGTLNSTVSEYLFGKKCNSKCPPGIKKGKICCSSLSNTRLDDIQIKLGKILHLNECNYWSVYGLLGIPTRHGSKSNFLFEPLVGSNHAQLGLGSDFVNKVMQDDCKSISILGEAKYRYGFKNKECRSFDLCNNGQWSRYLLAYKEDDRYNLSSAINYLTLPAQVTPRSSFDLYLAVHADYKDWDYEIGYNFWFRASERVRIKTSDRCINSIAIADLVGLSQSILNPISASQANISQAVLPGDNQIVQDQEFTPIEIRDLNLNSAAAPQAITNSIYFSLERKFTACNMLNSLGANVAYEHSSSLNYSDNVFAWASWNMLF